MHLLRQLRIAGCGLRIFITLAVTVWLASVRSARANPKGLIVGRGAATASQTGSLLTITASHNAWLNWSSFNIGPGETTTFVQPNSHSVVWNRINDSNPSQILGALNAN